MGELFWQLRQPRGVISLLWWTDEEKSQLVDKLYYYDTRRYRIFDGVKFDLHLIFDGTENGLFKVVDLARFILSRWYPDGEEENASDPLRWMNSDQVIIEKCRKFLTEHSCLLFIINLESTTDWNSIKKQLLYESTRGYIVVITSKQSVATHCVGHKQHRALNAEELMEGCGHRIGMSELFWQLVHHHRVVSLFWRTDEERSQLMYELYSCQYRVFGGLKIELHCCFDGTEDGLFKVVDLAMFILSRTYPEGEEKNASEQLSGMNSDQDLIKMCHNFLAEHTCLIFIANLECSMDWDLIKQQLLCESTRGYIVVITNDQSVATHCVDHEQDRVLNIEDLMEGSNQADKSGHEDGGSNIEEEDKLVLFGRGYGHDPFDHPGKGCSVWGIAGVGKSVYVRQYYNKIMSTQVYRMYGWVDVPHPFNLTALCQRLLLDLCSGDVDAKEAVAIGLLQGCIKILLEHKCLLVFDDLRSTHDWDLINTTLLSQLISGKTIVITREERITRQRGPDASSYIIVCSLDIEVAFELFTKVILNGKPLFPEAVEISKLILDKCGGLPEVIVAIGKQIRSAAQQIDSLLQILKVINDDFMGYLQLQLPNLSGLLSWMQSYFDACSDELKPCIFYMLVVPANQAIRWRRLISRWIAEGYLSGGTADQRGIDLVFELTKLSILYREGQISRTWWKLNGFFREYIKSRPMEDNRVFELDGSCSPSSRLTGQHLTISSSWDRDEIVFRSMDLSRLRSSTVSGDWRSFLICDKMKLLRVLDLEGTSTSDSTTSVTDDDLEQIGKLLPRLKFMSLRGCMHITRLPDSLSEMKQLETLDAKHTSIVELPPAIITKLHKLQHIIVGTTETRLFLVPARTPAPSQEDGVDGTSPFLQDKKALSRVVQAASTRAWKMACDLEESCNRLWQFKNQRRDRNVAANGGGVEVVPAAARGVGALTNLRTLGIVNVAGGKGAFLFLQELKKLTQLTKLRLSGITRKNWQNLCSAISGHRHLEVLTLQLLLQEEDGSYDFARFDDISEPPKTVTRLKVLYTSNSVAGVDCAWIRPTWIKQLVGKIRFDHDLTISSQEDIDLLYSQSLPGNTDRLRIKPIEQYLSSDNGFTPKVLTIDCSRIRSTVTFRGSGILVKELNIHCCSSCGWSCLRIFGLNHMENLEQVLVTGPCNNDYEQDLRRQLEEHPNKPELKLL